MTDWFCYAYAHQDVFVSCCHNVAISLYSITAQVCTSQLLYSNGITRKESHISWLKVMGKAGPINLKLSHYSNHWKKKIHPLYICPLLNMCSHTNNTWVGLSHVLLGQPTLESLVALQSTQLWREGLWQSYSNLQLSSIVSEHNVVNPSITSWYAVQHTGKHTVLCMSI